MGTKAKIFSIIFVFILFCLAANLPNWIISSVPTAEVIMPVTISHTPTISCEGTLQAKNIREKYTTQPLMIEEVYAKPWDLVKKGDILLKIDTETSAGLASGQPQNIELSQMDYYLELAKQYGLESEAQEYLSQQQTKAETVSSSSDEPLSQYITADTSGRLVSFSPKTGQLLSSGSKIYSIINGETYQAVFQVNEADISKISVGDKVMITGEGLGEKHYSAIVTEIAPTATKVFKGLEQNTVVEVTAEFSSDDNILRPGISLHGQIAIEDTTTMVSLPYEAISQDENNREYVYQLIDGNATKRYIQIEEELTDYAQISDGLEESAPVFLQNGSFPDAQNYHIVYREDWHD